MRSHTLWFGLVLLLSAGCGLTTSPSGQSGDEEANLRQERARAESARNLHRIGLAMLQYEETNGQLPQTCATHMPTPPLRNTALSWRVSLLPYLEQDQLWNSLTSLAPKEPWLTPALRDARLPVYECPLADKAQPGETYYRVFYGNGAAFNDVTSTYGRRLTEFPDGTRNTVLVVEAAEPVLWARNDELHYRPNQPLPKLGFLRDGFHVLMADGSVRFLPHDTAEQDLRAILTATGGEAKKLPGNQVFPPVR